MYSVDLGRFVSRDPLGYRIVSDVTESPVEAKSYYRIVSHNMDSALFSLYEYVGGKATRLTDPYGTNPKDLWYKVWDGRCKKAWGLDATGSSVLGVGATAGLQVMFFCDTCELALFAITPAAALTGQKPNASGLPATLKSAAATFALDLPAGLDISVSGNGTVAYYTGDSWGDAASWGGVFYGGTVSGGVLGKVGVGAFWDPKGNWVGASSGVGLTPIPGVQAKSNPQAYFLLGAKTLPDCLCYNLIFALLP